MSNKIKREGVFGAAIKPQTLQETDQLRGDIPRSRWIERALKMYNASVAAATKGDNNNNVDGVRGGARTTNLTHPTAPTPTPTSEAVHEYPTAFFNSGGSSYGS